MLRSNEYLSELSILHKKCAEMIKLIAEKSKRSMEERKNNLGATRINLKVSRRKLVAWYSDQFAHYISKKTDRIEIRYLIQNWKCLFSHSRLIVLFTRIYFSFGGFQVFFQKRLTILLPLSEEVLNMIFIQANTLLVWIFVKRYSKMQLLMSSMKYKEDSLLDSII